MRLLYLLPLAPLLLATPAFAQLADERIDQLEEQLMLLERKMERSSGSTTRPSVEATSGDSGVANAQADTRITALEEEIRKLRGSIEEKDFQNRRTAEELDKFKRDTEFRLGEMEKAAAAAAAAPPPTPAPEEKPAKPTAADKAAAAQKAAAAKKKAELTVKEVPDDEAAPPAEEAEPAAPVEEKPADDDAAAAATPREEYNYAFRLLNQNQYDEASKNFAAFTKKHPKDPLVGNAYYWRGETFYIRKDYASAMDNFRQGFEAMPNGPKAPDNLLKLGMSLAALKKKEEACIVLSQVATKYKTTSVNTATKAQAEQKRVGCE